MRIQHAVLHHTSTEDGSYVRRQDHMTAVSCSWHLWLPLGILPHCSVSRSWSFFTIFYGFPSSSRSPSLFCSVDAFISRYFFNCFVAYFSFMISFFFVRSCFSHFVHLFACFLSLFRELSFATFPPPLPRTVNVIFVLASHHFVAMCHVLLHFLLVGLTASLISSTCTSPRT